MVNFSLCQNNFLPASKTKQKKLIAKIPGDLLFVYVYDCGRDEMSQPLFCQVIQNTL